MGALSKADAPAVLRARGLSKSFGDRQALRGVEITVAKGEVVAIVGPNGAGKTTLLEVIAAAQRADEGTVELPAGGVGWVPQQLSVHRRLTVDENLRLFARLERVPDVDAAVDAMLSDAGLSERAGELVERLSGGLRQRVNVAVGLIGSPALVLLDEPSVALDPAQRERLWAFLEQRAAAGTALLIATHDIVATWRHADRVIVMGEGEVVFCGAPAELPHAGEEGDFEVAFVRFLEERGG